jgi:predicted RNA methylase
MTQRDIFERDDLPPLRQTSATLMTYQTPTWAAERLVEHYYPDLSPADLVLEPTCGEGHFLDAIPPHVPAVGVELDAGRAAIARRTGREVLVGDVLTIDLGLTRPSSSATHHSRRGSSTHCSTVRTGGSPRAVVG